MEASNALLRKQWMRYPMVGAVFAGAYWMGLQLPTRFFAKATRRDIGVDADTYKGQHDLVGRFRLFEDGNTSSAEDKLLDHLSMYGKDPLSKPELLDHLMKRVSQQTDLSQVFQVKRLGKDKNNIFYSFGKIHGLENIAFCDANELKATEGNPYKLQQLVNKVTPESIPGFSSTDEVQDSLADELN